MYHFTKNKFLWGIVMVVGLVALMSSCTTYSYTSRSTSILQNEMNSCSLGAEINVDFSHRVTATSEPQIRKSDAINEAQYKCINENNIDVVVDPIYKVEYNMFHKKAYKVTVVGYAGKYKQVPTGVDAVVEKNYKVEDIEKYKLINDPTFYQYYYQKDPVQGGDVTNYYINSNNGTSEVKKNHLSSTILPSPKASKRNKKQAKSPEYKKAKQIRDAGAVFTSLGMLSIGVPMLAVGQKRMKQYNH